MTATSTIPTRFARNGQPRNPKLNSLEQLIVDNGVTEGMGKKLAIKQLRDWEADGKTPEAIATQLGIAGMAALQSDADENVLEDEAVDDSYLDDVCE